ncbi:MAG: hypothetical protein QXX30_01470 [Candidatus Aenigmatarchaeota archaeon]
MPRKTSKKIENIEEIIQEYLETGAKIFALSKKYDIPYSTLRRLILNYFHENQLINTNEKYEFPYEGFECLDINCSFSWFPGGDIFVIKSLEKVNDGMGNTDYVWIAYRASKKSDCHFYPEDLENCYNVKDAKSRYKALKNTKRRNDNPSNK